jgi:hypothetical protein
MQSCSWRQVPRQQAAAQSFPWASIQSKLAWPAGEELERRMASVIQTAIVLLAVHPVRNPKMF